MLCLACSLWTHLAQRKSLRPALSFLWILPRNTTQPASTKCHSLLISVCGVRSHKLNVGFHNSFGKFWLYRWMNMFVLPLHTRGFHIMKSRTSSHRRQMLVYSEKASCNLSSGCSPHPALAQCHEQLGWHLLIPGWGTSACDSEGDSECVFTFLGFSPSTSSLADVVGKGQSNLPAYLLHWFLALVFAFHSLAACFQSSAGNLIDALNPQ